MTNAERSMLHELLTKYNAERSTPAPGGYPNGEITRALSEVQSLRNELAQLKQSMQLGQQSIQIGQQSTSAQNNTSDIDTILRSMYSSMQAMSAQSMQQPQQPQTIDQIMAEIVNPPLPDVGNEPNAAQFGGMKNGSK